MLRFFLGWITDLKSYFAMPKYLQFTSKEASIQTVQIRARNCLSPQVARDGDCPAPIQARFGLSWMTLIHLWLVVHKKMIEF